MQNALFSFHVNLDLRDQVGGGLDHLISVGEERILLRQDLGHVLGVLLDLRIVRVDLGQIGGQNVKVVKALDEGLRHLVELVANGDDQVLDGRELFSEFGQVVLGQELETLLEPRLGSVEEIVRLVVTTAIDDSGQTLEADLLEDVDLVATDERLDSLDHSSDHGHHPLVVGAGLVDCGLDLLQLGDHLRLVTLGVGLGGRVELVEVLVGGVLAGLLPLCDISVVGGVTIDGCWTVIS